MSPPSSTSTSSAVSNWAERNGVTYASYQELAGHPLVYDMIEKHVDEVNRSLASEPRMGGAQIKRFLDPAQGTRCRRRRAHPHAEGAPRLHRRALRAADRRPLRRLDEADISTEVTFEDGRKGVISARVKISDMKLYPVADRASRSWRRGMRAPDGTRVRRQGRRAARGRQRVAGVRRREGDHRRVLRHPQERDPRHHRPQRRRQDLDAQLINGFYHPSRAASPSRA